MHGLNEEVGDEKEDEQDARDEGQEDRPTEGS